MSGNVISSGSDYGPPVDIGPGRGRQRQRAKMIGSLRPRKRTGVTATTATRGREVGGRKGQGSKNAVVMVMGERNREQMERRGRSRIGARARAGWISKACWVTKAVPRWTRDTRSSLPARGPKGT